MCSCLTAALLHGHLLNLRAVSLRSSLKRRHLLCSLASNSVCRLHSATGFLKSDVWGELTSSSGRGEPASNLAIREWGEASFSSQTPPPENAASPFSLPVSASFKTQHLSFRYFVVVGEASPPVCALFWLGVGLIRFGALELSWFFINKYSFLWLNCVPSCYV